MFKKAFNKAKRGFKKGIELCDKAVKGIEKHGKALLLAVGVGGAALINGTVAQAQITLPEPLGAGVSLTDYITLAITGLGTIFAAVLGGFFSFRLLKMGLKYVGKIGG